jgi:hypothetical protein
MVGIILPNIFHVARWAAKGISMSTDGAAVGAVGATRFLTIRFSAGDTHISESGDSRVANGRQVRAPEAVPGPRDR